MNAKERFKKAYTIARSERDSVYHIRICGRDILFSHGRMKPPHYEGALYNRRRGYEKLNGTYSLDVAYQHIAIARVYREHAQYLGFKLP